jgi:hypothetical protein
MKNQAKSIFEFKKFELTYSKSIQGGLKDGDVDPTLIEPRKPRV